MGLFWYAFGGETGWFVVAGCVHVVKVFGVVVGVGFGTVVWAMGVVSMKSRPRDGGGSRRERGESYEFFLGGPRGSEAVRTVPSLGSSLFSTDGPKSSLSGR